MPECKTVNVLLYNVLNQQYNFLEYHLCPNISMNNIISLYRLYKDVKAIQSSDIKTNAEDTLIKWILIIICPILLFSLARSVFIYLF